MINSAPKDLSECRAFFLVPHTPKQRIYEALRAYFIEGRPPKEVARNFGYTVGSFHVLCQYDGEWSDGKQQGTGTLTTADGTSYQGEWKNGEPDGRGTMRDASGQSVTGNWKAGRYIGPGDEDTEKNK